MQTYRFRMDRCLGRGGFGVVYLAHDTKRGSQVAVKILHDVEPAGLYWFKQEFRNLADIRHPNLVKLYELVSQGDQWCFTMEPVDGIDFYRYVRRLPSGAAVDRQETTETGSTCDYGRLRAALRQLTEGVRALHTAGKLHRDLKPSNVLVTPAGRVVILDFGLVRDLDAEGFAETLRLIGTPAYMSPEQSWGAPLTVASDWYAVGVMLFEALVGRSPFSGSVGTMLEQKRKWEPADAQLPAGTPADLAAICKGLLKIRPEQRIGATEILDSLPADQANQTEVGTRVRVSTARPFVGRQTELTFLHRAAGAATDERPTLIFLHGRSGLGKSTLAHQFLDELRVTNPDTIILRARCYEQESVPYKGLDNLIDSLVQYLRSVPALELESILPRELHALEQLFPVMREIASQVTPRRPLQVTDPWEFRRRGARALRELLARLSDLRRIVLFVDDGHWGDMDSARLLQDILRPPDAPPLLLLISYRTEEAGSPYVSELMKFALSAGDDIGVRELALGDLSIEDSRNLAVTLAVDASLTEGDTLQIARESEGSPFFVQELVRHRQEMMARPPGASAASTGAVTLDALMGNRLLQLDADSRQCLELLAVSGRPVGRDALIQAAGVANHAAALDNLRERNLLRSRSGEVEEYEIYHARMTRGVLMHVSDARLKELHRRLAVAQEEIGADAETLYHHYHQSGERTRAAAFAVAAAGQAARALAFDRAANLYARALEDSPPDHESLRDIRVRLGDALAMAGRGVEAAGAYLAAAEGAPQPEQIRLRERAMGQFFRTGRFDEGLATLRAILPALRLKWPETSQQAVAALVLRRLQLRIRGLSFRERDVASVPSDDLVRIDACLSVSTGLSVVENVRAALFQTRALLWALDTGEPLRVTRAMVLEAAFSALGGSRTRKRTEQLFARVSELTARVDKPDTHALAMVARGVALHLNGEWRRAVEIFLTAEQLLSQHASEVVQELDNARTFALYGLAQMGRFREVNQRLPSLVADAENRGDLYAKSMFAFRRSLMHVVADDPASAKGVSAQAVSEWSRAGFHATHYADLQCQGNAGLYSGAPEDVREHLDRIQGPLQRSRFLRLQMVFVEVAHLRARTYLALAAKNIESAAMLKAAAREAEGLERQGVAWGTALALLVRAGIAATTSDRDKAAELLAAAEQALSSADLVIHELAARYRRGQLGAGAQGQLLMADAHDEMRTRGVANPLKYAGMLVPGRFS